MFEVDENVQPTIEDNKPFVIVSLMDCKGNFSFIRQANINNASVDEICIRTGAIGDVKTSDLGFNIMQGDGNGIVNRYLAMTTLFKEDLAVLGITEPAKFARFGPTIMRGFSMDYIGTIDSKTAQQTLPPPGFDGVVVLRGHAKLNLDKIVRAMGLPLSAERAFAFLSTGKQKCFTTDGSMLTSTRWNAYIGFNAEKEEVPIDVPVPLQPGQTCMNLHIVNGFVHDLVACAEAEYFMLYPHEHTTADIAQIVADAKGDYRKATDAYRGTAGVAAKEKAANEESYIFCITPRPFVEFVSDDAKDEEEVPVAEEKRMRMEEEVIPEEKRMEEEVIPEEKRMEED